MGQQQDLQRHTIQEFLDRLEDDAKNEFRILNGEFAEIRREQIILQNGIEHCCDIGQKICHWSRNRYRDILPYDKNRVRLIMNGFNTDGYINASHISFADTSTKYIAAQAPLTTTLDDFWTMVFENNVELIVMLCKCFETGMPKCEKYWTDDERNPGVTENVQAYKTEEHSYEDFLWRKMNVKSKKHGEKTINHLQFTEWPDHGCPNGQKHVIEFIKLFDRLREESAQQTILLHCSAGCGRTGSLIAINVFRELLNTNKLKTIDVKKIVIELRKQRVCMVQTLGQYIFLHKMIAHYCHEWINSGAGAVNESKPIELANEVLATNDVPKTTTTPRGPVISFYAEELKVLTMQPSKHAASKPYLKGPPPNKLTYSPSRSSVKSSISPSSTTSTSTTTTTSTSQQVSPNPPSIPGTSLSPANHSPSLQAAISPQSVAALSPPQAMQQQSTPPNISPVSASAEETNNSHLLTEAFSVEQHRPKLPAPIVGTPLRPWPLPSLLTPLSVATTTTSESSTNAVMENGLLDLGHGQGQQHQRSVRSTPKSTPSSYSPIHATKTNGDIVISIGNVMTHNSPPKYQASISASQQQRQKTRSNSIPNSQGKLPPPIPPKSPTKQSPVAAPSRSPPKPPPKPASPRIVAAHTTTTTNCDNSLY